MKTINRRLRKLEEGFGLVPETEDDRRLRERLEAGRRRVAEARARGECGGPVGEAIRSETVNLRRGMTVVDILILGRERARQQSGGAAQPGTPG